MIATCFECGARINRYSCNTWSDPCECGSTKFWIHHLGTPWWMGNRPPHRILKDVKTGEMFSTDECDLYDKEMK
jgi:hypothetical protein